LSYFTLKMKPSSLVPMYFTFNDFALAVSLAGLLSAAVAVLLVQNAAAKNSAVVAVLILEMVVLYIYVIIGYKMRYLFHWTGNRISRGAFLQKPMDKHRWI
jgi:hypothetical protein